MNVPPRYYAIADANDFYVSCERVFEPRYRGRQVVVLSNNDGCVIARSEEAKAAGIVVGKPFFELRDRVDRGEIVALSSNYTLYGDMSRRLMNLFAARCHDLEVYSIDEAFMELQFAGQTPGSLVTWAEGLRAEALRLTGLPTAFGLARTKTLAKLANHAAKRICGVPAHYLDPGDPLLDEIPVSEVWGCGRAYVSRLAAVGVTTAAHLRDVDEEWMRRQFGVVGQRLVRELRGEPSIAFATAPPPRRHMMVSRSFQEDLEDHVEIERRLALFASRLGQNLREHGKQTATLVVYAWFNQFKLPSGAAQGYSRTVTLPVPTDHDAHLVAWSRVGLRSLLQPGRAYKKVGVMAPDLIDTEATQASLFAAPGRHRRDSGVMAAIHALNRRYGKGTVYVAACEESPAELPLRRDRHTPRYTTRVTDLAEVRPLG